MFGVLFLLSLDRARKDINKPESFNHPKAIVGFPFSRKRFFQRLLFWFMNAVELKELLLQVLGSSKRTSDKKISEAFQIWLSWAEFNLSKKSVELGKIVFKHFLKFRGDLALSQIDSLVVDQFIIYLMKRAPKGYAVYFRTIRSMFSKFVAWNFIQENYFLKIKLKKVQQPEQKFLTEEEFYKLIEFEKNRTLKFLYKLTFLSGLRLSEVANLCWENVDLAKGFITIGGKEFITKSRKVRRIPLPIFAVQILESLKPKVFSIDKPNFIFCKSNGFKYSNDFISKSFKRVVRKAGFDPQLHFHSLRHSFTSLLLAKNVNLYIVKELLGHSSISVTEGYSHVNFSSLKNAIEVLNHSQTNQTEVQQ
jgi:integrase/recombinase XerD